MITIANEILTKRKKGSYVDITGKLRMKNKEKTYLNNLGIVTSFSKQNPNIESFEDLDYIILTVLLSNKSEATKIKQIQLFKSIANVNIKSDAIRKKYYELISKNRNNDVLKENKPINIKEKNSLKITYEDLKNKIDYNSSKKDDILYLLLIHLKHTPRLDYRTLIYVNNDKQIQSFNNNKEPINYIFLKPTDSFIMLNDYKTCLKYGSWKIEIPNDITKIIQNYITKSNIEPNTYIFKNNRNKQYPSNKFSEYIQKIIYKKVKVKITMNTLRKIKEIHLFHRNPFFLNKSYKEKEKWVIEHFKHDLKMSMLWYNKVFD